MEEDLDLVYTSFKQEYNIDLMKDNISLKSYQVLLNNLSPESQLMKIVSVRALEDWEIQDPNLRRSKQSIELKQNKPKDSLKQFMMAMKGE